MAIDCIDADQKPSVLMPSDDLASFDGTADLLRSPRAAERPIRAAEAFEQRSGTERDISR